MISPENIEKLIRNAEIDSNPDVNQAVLENLIKQFDVTDEQKAPFTQLNERRILVKSPITKYAIAAVILIAVTFGLFELIDTSSKSGIVWAEVAEKVQGSQGYTYRTIQNQTVKGMDPIEIRNINYNSPEYGMKIESCPGEEKTITTCINYSDMTNITLIHRLKAYTQESLPENAVPESHGLSIPKEMVKQFLSGENRKELGQQIIEGVLAEGIEVDNPPGGMGNFTIDSCIGRLWVSVETGYPVMLEINVVGNNGDVRIEMTMDQFQWDVELDAEMFKVDIPSDYTPMEMPQS